MWQVWKEAGEPDGSTARAAHPRCPLAPSSRQTHGQELSMGARHFAACALGWHTLTTTCCLRTPLRCAC
eukprot:10213101-Alexandrium_andersonii.AAC.1